MGLKHIFSSSILAALLLSAVEGQRLVSCAHTVCSSERPCRIIQRCYGGDCNTGTGCVDPAKLPLDRTDFKCPFDDPLLRSLDGGALVEIKCGSSNPLGVCPSGSLCTEPAGVCCTGAPKSSAPCPSAPENFFQTNGGCSTFCRHDQECPGFHRCCPTGMGCNQCMSPAPPVTCETHVCDPGLHCLMKAGNCTSYPCLAEPACVPDKAGICPVLQGFSNCKDECLVDSHCTGDRKCCMTDACHVCVSPMQDTTTSPPTTYVAPASSSSTPVFGFDSFSSMDSGNNVAVRTSSASPTAPSGGPVMEVLRPQPPASTLPSIAVPLPSSSWVDLPSRPLLGDLGNIFGQSTPPRQPPPYFMGGLPKPSLVQDTISFNQPPPLRPRGFHCDFLCLMVYSGSMSA